MTEQYIKITGSNQIYQLIEKSSLPNHRIQLVVDDDEGNRFVFTRQSGSYTLVHKPVRNEYEDS